MLQSSNLSTTSNSQGDAGFNLLTLSALFEIELQQMLLQEQQDKPLRTGLHASALLIPEEQWCVRRHVLAERFPDRVERIELMQWQWKTHSIFENGWDLHQRWQQVFLNAGIAVFNREMNDYELDLTHVDQEGMLHFSPDAIIEYGGIQYVVEIKGYNDRTYQQMIAAPHPPEAAHRQCNLYMHMLGLKRGFVLVENKNTQDFHVWAVAYDFDMTQLYIDRLYQVKGKLATGSMPARKCFSPGDTLARSCPMRKICFEMEG